jgi:hypothetical protein
MTPTINNSEESVDLVKKIIKTSNQLGEMINAFINEQIQGKLDPIHAKKFFQLYEKYENTQKEIKVNIYELKFLIKDYKFSQDLEGEKINKIKVTITSLIEKSKEFDSTGFKVECNNLVKEINDCTTYTDSFKQVFKSSVGLIIIMAGTVVGSVFLILHFVPGVNLCLTAIELVIVFSIMGALLLTGFGFLVKIIWNLSKITKKAKELKVLLNILHDNHDAISGYLERLVGYTIISTEFLINLLDELDKMCDECINCFNKNEKKITGFFS